MNIMNPNGMIQHDEVTILIVEDSSTQAALLQFILEEHGFTVAAASNGKKALTYAREKKPALIISDIVMPEMDGYEMCRAIKTCEATQRIPVILLTTLSDPLDIIRGLEAMCDDYNIKPFDEDYLLSQIDYFLKNPIQPEKYATPQQFEFTYLNVKHVLHSDPERILKLLLSTYENTILQNNELKRTKSEVQKLNCLNEKKIMELHVSEDRFKTLVMTIPDIVYKIDERGIFTFVNDSVKHLGYTPEEIIGRHFSEFIYPDDVESVSRESVLSQYWGKKTGDANAPKLFDERRTGERRTSGLVIRILQKDGGKLIPALIDTLSKDHIIAEINSSGSYEINPATNHQAFIGTVGVIRDITERKQYEDQILFQGSLLESISESSREGMLIVSNEMEIISYNKRFIEMFQIDDVDIKGQQGPELFSWIQKQLIEPELFSKSVIHLQEHKGEQFLFELQLKNGVFWDCYSSSIEGKDNTYYGRGWYFLDITGRKRSEQALERYRDHLEDLIIERTAEIQEVNQKIKKEMMEREQAEEYLRQSQKMEAIGRLAGGVAHDFNNLIMAIKGYAKFAIERVGQEHPVQEDLQEILNAGERGSQLTRQLLAFSRRQVAHVDNLNLNQVIENMKKMLQRLIGEHVELMTVLDPSLGNVKADTGLMEQVLLNLSINARDAMPEGGRLTIETANIEINREDVSHFQGVVNPGQYIILRVCDSGTGMNPETLSRLFEPFYTTKEMGYGTGLGLATVYGIIQQNNGDIQVQSQLDEGSTFTIYLPRSSDPDFIQEEQPQRVSLTSEGETVLLVEDDASVRSVVNRTLQSKGYSVLVAENGEMGLKISNQYEDKIHVVISDIIMPQMGGPEMIKQIIMERPDIKVLFMSGYPGDVITKKGSLRISTNFIQKPVDPDKLITKVQEILCSTSSEPCTSTLDTFTNGEE